jgi:hypothetical protein
METIKYLALAADGVCAVLIIGVGVYRAVRLFKEKSV